MRSPLAALSLLWFLVNCAGANGDVVIKRVNGGPLDLMNVMDQILMAHSETEEPADSAQYVTILNDSSIDAFVEQGNAAAVVLFFAPWGRDILRNFRTAASVLGHQTSEVKFGILDTTVNIVARGKYEVKLFPMISMYANGQTYEYIGGRHHTHIVKWISEILETEITVTSVEQLQNLLNIHDKDFVVVGSFEATAPHSTNFQGHTVLAPGGHQMAPRPAVTANSAAETFVNVSQHFGHDDKMFIDVASDELLLTHLQEAVSMPASVKTPFVAVINPYTPRSSLLESLRTGIFSKFFASEPRGILYEGDITNSQKLSEFVRHHTLPLIVPFRHEVIEPVFSDGRPMLALFLDGSDEDKALAELEAFRSVATKHREDLITIVSWRRDDVDARLRSITNCIDDPLPAMRLFTLNPQGHHSWVPWLKYIPPSEIMKKPLDSRLILNFVDSYFSGSLTPAMRSEDIPSKQENDGAVRNIVGLSFDREVREAENDVFVMFFAPWCGHCKKAEPLWNDLGRRLSPLKNLTICKLDANLNDVPGLTISAYPTFLLFPAHKKKHPGEYRGDRSVASWIKWLHDHVDYKFDVDAYLQVSEETIVARALSVNVKGNDEFDEL